MIHRIEVAAYAKFDRDELPALVASAATVDEGTRGTLWLMSDIASTAVRAMPDCQEKRDAFDALHRPKVAYLDKDKD